MSERFRIFPTLVLYALMLAPAVSLFHIWPLNSAVVDALSFLLVGLLIAVVLLGQKDAQFRFNQSLYFFLLLIVALGVSVWLNDYSYAASWRWYLISLFFCVVITIAGCEWKSGGAGRFHSALAASLWFGCLVYGVVSLLKYYGLLAQILFWIEPPVGRLSGIWYQPNLTTTTSWLGLLAGSVWLSCKSRPGWFILSVVVFGWVIACAASRISWLMAIGLLVLLMVSQLPRFRTEDAQIATRWLFWGLVVTVIMLFTVPLINAPLRELLAQIGFLQNGVVVPLTDREALQDAARLTEFRKLLTSLDGLSGQEWLFGIGPSNYPGFSYNAESAIPPENLVSATWLHSHNLFTMIFVEFGLVGLALIIGFVGLIAWFALSRPFDTKHFFSIGGLGLLFIHSNLEFPLWYPWFLMLCCLLLVNLFDVREVSGDSRALKPAAGVCIAIMVVALLVNVGYQYLRIIDVALDPEPGAEEHQSLALLANDSLMGPYAVLRKYRDFPPEKTHLDWQLGEVRRMVAWQPRDLVVLREYTLLVMKGDLDGACAAAEATAYRYPHSAPIMLSHAVKAGTLQPTSIVAIANCIEKGLAPRGETIPSVEAKNQRKLSGM